MFTTYSFSRLNPRVILGLIFFTVIIHKSEDKKPLRDCLENLPKRGPLDNQTFPWSWALEKV